MLDPKDYPQFVAVFSNNEIHVVIHPMVPLSENTTQFFIQRFNNINFEKYLNEHANSQTLMMIQHEVDAHLNSFSPSDWILSSDKNYFFLRGFE